MMANCPKPQGYGQSNYGQSGGGNYQKRKFEQETEQREIVKLKKTRLTNMMEDLDEEALDELTKLTQEKQGEEAPNLN